MAYFFRLRSAFLIGSGVGLSGTAVQYGSPLTDLWQRSRNEFTGTRTAVLPPTVDYHRTVASEVDTSGLQLRLYQYQTCPFCCKVRTFLDYYGFAYDVVEVNPVTRKQIKKLGTGVRKVPQLVSAGYNNMALNESSVIVSILASFLNDSSSKLDEIESQYPTITYLDEDTKKEKTDVANKYFVMLDGASEKEIERMNVERRWRKWADADLVHMLSPNVYRTFDEAVESFEYFSVVGHWKDIMPAWEERATVYLGAAAMFLIAKKLKKKHSLRQDVRESLYESCRKWNKALGKQRFLGGDRPNLADLAVYGVLCSIEGCSAFNDVREHCPRTIRWFNDVKTEVERRAGSKELANSLAKSRKALEAHLARKT